MLDLLTRRRRISRVTRLRTVFARTCASRALFPPLFSLPCIHHLGLLLGHTHLTTNFKVRHQVLQHLQIGDHGDIYTRRVPVCPPAVHVSTSLPWFRTLCSFGGINCTHRPNLSHSPSSLPTVHAVPTLPKSALPSPLNELPNPVSCVCPLGACGHRQYLGFVIGPHRGKKLTPRARVDRAALIEDALLVGRDELHAAPKLVALAVLLADGARVADVGEDVGPATLTGGQWDCQNGQYYALLSESEGSLTGARLAEGYDGHGSDKGVELHLG